MAWIPLPHRSVPYGWLMRGSFKSNVRSKTGKVDAAHASIHIDMTTALDTRLWHERQKV